MKRLRMMIDCRATYRSFLIVPVLLTFCSRFNFGPCLSLPEQHEANPCICGDGGRRCRRRCRLCYMLQCLCPSTAGSITINTMANSEVLYEEHVLDTQHLQVAGKHKLQ